MLSFEFCCIVQVPVLSVAFWDILLVPYNFMREKYQSSYIKGNGSIYLGIFSKLRKY